MTGGRWIVEGFYGERASGKRVPGDRAFRTEVPVPSAAQTEVLAAARRDDIGRVVVTPPDGVELPGWAEAYR